MIAILQLLAILGIGYLGTHYVAERFRARFHVATGVEFVVLGVLVGPHVTDVMTPDVLNQLGPVISLAVGAVGLVLGLEFPTAIRRTMRAEALELSFFGVLGTVLIVGGGAAGLAWLILPQEAFMAALPVAVALGAVAAVSAPEPIVTVHRQMEGQVRLAGLLESSAKFDQGSSSACSTTGRPRECGP